MTDNEKGERRNKWMNKPTTLHKKKYSNKVRILKAYTKRKSGEFKKKNKPRDRGEKMIET